MATSPEEDARMPARPLEIRNLRFDLDEVPRHWNAGRKAVTAFYDNLSVFFPAGERFFIASVRAHADRVKDAALARDVKGFCGQEAVHSREHLRYNDMLRRQGYPIDDMERRVIAILDRVGRRTPKRWQLAATCALEHFTALMGHVLLADRELLEGAHPTMAALWRWHAAEENEHKALAFDVYRAAGGNDVERAALMLAATVIFWSKVVEQQARMMATDGIAFSPREWWSLVRYLFVEPGSMRRLIPLYLRYYRPGFHPNDVDDGGLLEAWRAAYEERRVAAE
jgi:predicted metal-dependent hydrolase